MAQHIISVECNLWDHSNIYQGNALYKIGVHPKYINLTVYWPGRLLFLSAEYFENWSLSNLLGRSTHKTTRNLIYAVIHYVFGIGEGIPSHLNVLLNFKRLRFHWHFLQHPLFHLGELGQAAFYIHGDENGRRTHNYITGMELEKIQRDCTHQ